MNNKPFTIIICTYNGGARIGRVLDKILSQDSLEKLIYQILVVDNNSNDNTKEVINRYASNSSLVNYVFEKQPGVSYARKTGVQKTETEWIIFLDDDNYITPHWLESMNDYRLRNERVGVYNGAVIPSLEFENTEDYNRRLESSYKVLACTHLDEKELQNKPDTPFRNPIGAGMTIRTLPLKQLIEKGWLSASGRTKDNLASGEDGEMAYWVKKQGYQFGFCKDAILYHGIPQARLEDEYLTRMWYEIGKGVVIVLKKQDKFCVIRYLYLLMKRIQSSLLSKNSYKKKYLEIYLKGYKDEL